MKQFLCLVVLLCPFLWAKAQVATNKQTVTDTAIRGETIPDIIINGVDGLSLKDKPVTSARTRDFKGKLLIIDFWATWCAPCRAMVPIMDSLQRAFAGRVVFLSVSYENRTVVAPVVAQLRKQHPFDLPEVFGDTKLKALFPHRALPHYVWIDSSGVYRAATGFEQVTGANIRRMLAGATGLLQKSDIRVPYDKGKPLFIGGNGGAGEGMVFHSMLAGFREGIGGGMNISAFDRVSGQRFTVRNAPLLWLARLAYADGGRWFPNARVLLLSRDSLKMSSRLTGSAYNAWLKAGNGWCYELQVPPFLADSAFALIRSDLGRLFPFYRISCERRVVRSLVLVRTGSGAMPLAAAGGAASVSVTPFGCHLHGVGLSELVIRLERQFMQGSKLPLADGTGFSGPVDLDFEADMRDVGALNRGLAVYGLALVERDFPAELLIINDKL